MRPPTWLSSMQWHSSSMCRHECNQLMCSVAHHHKAADGAGMMQALCWQLKQRQYCLHAAGCMPGGVHNTAIA